MKLLYDLFPLLLFFGAYLTFDIFVATAVAIAASVIQVGAYWWRHRRFEKMQLIGLGLLALLGGLTLVSRNSSFIMWKPTVVHWLFALVILGSHVVGKRTLADRVISMQITLPPSVTARVNFSWGVYFLVWGFVNLYIAFYFAPDWDPQLREKIWVYTKTIGFLVLTGLFIVAQALYLGRYVPDDAPGRAP
jgi:intracellular septation protein